MQKAAVLPVPFFARARMSRLCTDASGQARQATPRGERPPHCRDPHPVNAMGMLSSWMGEGRSKPFSKMPASSSRFKK